MPRPPSSTLTDYELAILRILWRDGALSVGEILARFPRRPKPAYTSLLTGVRTMAKKGYLSRVRDGKAHRYAPMLKRYDYRRVAIRRLVSGLFEGDAKELAAMALRSAGIEPPVRWGRAKSRLRSS